MNHMTILMVLHNEADYVKLSLQSIRMFADIEHLSVVIVDNHSEDALQAWAKEQQDITYIYMDEGKLPFGQVVNDVCRALQIEGDLLIMDSHYLITPHTLSRMQELLYQEDATGAVSGVSNSFLADQRSPDLADYEAAVKWADGELQTKQGKWALGLNSDIILLKASAITNLGKFNEELSSQEYVMKDYGFRLVIENWKQQICQNALFWDMRENASPYKKDTAEDAAMLEKKWGIHYINTFYNLNLLDMIAPNEAAPIRVLDIGCSCGANLLEVRNRYPHAEVYGIELNKNAAMVASHVANVEVGNIEDQNLRFTPHFFDYIMFGDVLEHLHDPLSTIQYCSGLLKEDGYILACIPNLMHISVMEDLLRGNFTYTEGGLLDRTHIHLFTYNEIIKMFEAGGYQIEKIQIIMSSFSEDQKSLIDSLLEIAKDTPRFMYEAFQYGVRAKNMACIKKEL